MIESWTVPFRGHELSRLIAKSLTQVPLIGDLKIAASSIAKKVTVE